MALATRTGWEWKTGGVENWGEEGTAMDSTERRPGTVAADPISELTYNLSQTARILFAAGSVTETLAQVVELAVDTIEGCDFAGIFLVEDDVVTSPIHTDPIVDEVDDLQNELGEGPCLDAMSHRAIFYGGDLVEDDRWPEFGRRASAAGIRSVLALPLPDNGGSGALNLYARFPGAFGVLDRAKAVILASLAGLALSAARTHEDEERRADNLNAALATREVIGQAQGILMERERVSSGQAFDVLRRASQHLNRKLRDVAQDLVDTGERPDTGTSQ
jgi:GAF domain-containing protein